MRVSIKSVTDPRKQKQNNSTKFLRNSFLQESLQELKSLAGDLRSNPNASAYDLRYSNPTKQVGKDALSQYAQNVQTGAKGDFIRETKLNDQVGDNALKLDTSIGEIANIESLLRKQEKGLQLNPAELRQIREKLHDQDSNWIVDSFDKLPENIFGEREPGQSGFNHYYGFNENDINSFEGGDNFKIKKLDLGNNSKAIEELGDTKIDFEGQKDFSGYFKEKLSPRLYLFSDAEHMDKAAAYQIRKLKDTGNEHLIGDSKSLATLTALNISEDGLKHGVAQLLERNIDVRSRIPKGVATKGMKAAWERGEKNIARADYITGDPMLGGNEMEKFGHDINLEAANKYLSDMGESTESFNSFMKNTHGFYGENRFFQLHGAALAATNLDSKMFESGTGSNGFDTKFEKMVDDYYQEHGELPSFALTTYLMNNDNADHSALQSSMQGELPGTTSLIKHYNGGFLKDRSNQLVLAFQSDTKHAEKKLGEVAEIFKRTSERYGDEATLTGFQYIQKGHGGVDGHTLLDQDKQILAGVKDSKGDSLGYLGKFTQSMAENNGLKYANVSCDSCYQKLSSDALSQDVKDGFNKAGVNARVDSTGSVQEGQVLANRQDSEQGLETFVNHGGGVMPLWVRHDRSGTGVFKTEYTGKGELAYQSDIQSKNVESNNFYSNISDNDREINNEWINNSETAKTDIESNEKPLYESVT